MNERQLVLLLTAVGVLASAFGLGLTCTKFWFRQSAVRATGTITITPAEQWVLRFNVHDRAIELPIDRPIHHEELMSYSAGSGVAILSDPEEPSTIETVRSNSAGIVGGLLLIAIGAAFAFLGFASLRYLSKSRTGRGAVASG